MEDYNSDDASDLCDLDEGEEGPAQRAAGVPVEGPVDLSEGEEEMEEEDDSDG